MTQEQVPLLLAQAQQAAQNGDNSQARALLSQIIKSEPGNETAWLLFAQVAEKREHSIYCLEQVLKLNPVNMQAVEHLNALRAPTPAAATPPPATPVATPVARAATMPPSESETVISREHAHWATFIGPAIILLLGVLMTSTLPSLVYDATISIIVGAVLLTLGSYILLRSLVVYFTHEFVLTNKRITIKTGLFSRNTFEILLTQIEAIGVSQSLVGRIFGYGSILVSGTGGAKQVFGGMRSPVKFRERIQTQISDLQKSS